MFSIALEMKISLQYDKYNNTASVLLGLDDATDEISSCDGIALSGLQIGDLSAVGSRNYHFLQMLLA